MIHIDKQIPDLSRFFFHLSRWLLNPIVPSALMDTAAGKGSKELVFIVDDEALLGQLADTLLTEAGYQTKTFLDPVDALREIRDDGIRPALLVTDYVMGTMTGLELIEECKKVHPTLRTILLSGTVSESYVHKFSTQPDQFIPKPYVVSKFVKAVKQTLGHAD